MEIPSRPSSRQFSLPGKPEAGLAEWTQKIKAMQRQVDADEEEEHRRLEKEIQASRLARVRRSAGYASRLSTPEPAPRSSSQTSETPDGMVDRQQGQDEALQKLIGRSSSPLPEPVSPIPRSRSPISPKLAPKAPVSSNRPEPVSLAAFIGGRATGPRLNKHAPQQDAHDPTQFEQRTHITSPHPIFGRGGVAMPGLAAKGRPPPSPTPDRSAHDSTSTTTNGQHTDLEPIRERRMSTSSNSPAFKRYMEHVEQHSVQPQKTNGNGRDVPRTRTMSTPTGSAPVRSTAQSSSLSSRPEPLRPITPRSAEPSLPLTPRSATFENNLTPTSPKPYSKPPTVSVSPPVSSKPSFPPYSPKPPVSLPTRVASVPTPSLARPVPPAAKPPSFIPQVSSSPSPSPAFLRTSTGPKEPTPSISRLKGRGFVQSIVQASSQLEAASNNNRPPVPEITRTSATGGKRLSSVADRWKSESSAPAPSPPVAPKSVASPKARTVDDTPHVAKPIEPEPTGRSLRKAPSVPALSAMHTGSTHVSSAKSVTTESSSSSSKRRSLGSSSTMISYIKPMKTGDDPAPTSSTSYSRPGTPSAHSRPATPSSHSRPVTPSSSRHDTDGYGLRANGARNRGDGGTRPSELPLSGKPLSHLTKDRAKRPKKKKTGTVTFKDVEPELKTTPNPRADEVPQQLSASRSPSQASRTISPSPAAATPAVSNAPTPKLDAPSPSPIPPKDAAPQRGGVADRWGGQSLLGVKSVGKPTPPSESKQEGKSMIGAQALPGLATTPSEAPSKPGPSRSPRRHSRIPSTGNLATVMDVAQILHEKQDSLPSPESTSPSPLLSSPPLKVDLPSTVPGTRPDVLHAPPMERRRSSYDKFSAMPVLKEVPTPAATLARKVPAPVVEDVVPAVSERPVLIANSKPAAPEKLPEVVEAKPQTQSKTVIIQHVDPPLPAIDIDAIINIPSFTLSPESDIQTISVDVMVITGATAVTLAQNTDIFYENEVLAVVHRFKSKSNGLVTTKVWGWRGKQSTAGDLEQQKLSGMARRYGSPLIDSVQCSEPPELVRALGGRLAIRQGSRSHWSSENTTMHLVRTVDGNIFIDEHDLSIANLCSGFSYCITLLGSSYVWYGRGSLNEEREAALAYARLLTTDDASVVELVEGESDDDEMFWMMLGDREYAKADYWKWRPNSRDLYDPRVWCVDNSKGNTPLTRVTSISATRLQSSVFVIDCTWELFVLVGKDARGQRQDIRIALAAARAVAERLSPMRPFTPPVHAIVLPSRIPAELRFHFRDLSEEALNEEQTPDHMNLVALAEADDHLGRTTWERGALRDPGMLPLGLHPSDIP
ncbi:hypothetical protein OF83DRAFT_1168897 [Amylostereum chailletii]|nr:hypothetical protein OF83DRAFT_1168897 [Amylostereum chailletii]